jgi:hypothetical protein
MKNLKNSPPTIEALPRLQDDPRYVQALAKKQAAQEKLRTQQKELADLEKGRVGKLAPDDLISRFKLQTLLAQEQNLADELRRRAEQMQEVVSQIASEAGINLQPATIAIWKQITTAAQAFLSSIEALENHRRQFELKGYDRSSLLPYVMASATLFRSVKEVKFFLQVAKSRNDPVF